MKLTKLEHAALLVEEAGKKLFVDPGSFTTALTNTPQTAAVVITHQHADHWTPEQLDRVLDKSPDAQIFGPPDLAEAASQFAINVVTDGDVVEVGPFTLRFFGEKHNVIHRSIPVIDNVGVLINERLYYAGDSYTVPSGVDIDVMGVPAGAPWLKIGDVMDFVLEAKPKRTFPVHEMTLSTIGKNFSNQRIKTVTEEVGGAFYPLVPGDTLDI